MPRNRQAATNPYAGLLAQPGAGYQPPEHEMFWQDTVRQALENLDAGDPLALAQRLAKDRTEFDGYYSLLIQISLPNGQYYNPLAEGNDPNWNLRSVIFSIIMKIVENIGTSLVSPIPVEPPLWAISLEYHQKIPQEERLNALVGIFRRHMHRFQIQRKHVAYVMCAHDPSISSMWWHSLLLYVIISQEPHPCNFDPHKFAKISEGAFPNGDSVVEAVNKMAMLLAIDKQYHLDPLQ